MGIGLYLTRDIINKQKGYIKVASDENGSVFRCFLKKRLEQQDCLSIFVRMLVSLKRNYIL